MKKTVFFGILISVLFLNFGCYGNNEEEYGDMKESKDTNEQIVNKGRADLWNFDSDETGKISNGFSNQMTGKGGLGKWEVVRDETAPSKSNVLSQTSQEYSGYYFSMAINENETYDDFELSVKFKGVKGREDQGGGPVWRYQDQDNYYIARANPLESNFRVYKVVDGNRLQMESVRLKVTSNEWHTIKIIARKNHIKCYYDGRLYLETTDNTFQKGKVGLWTKADAVTCFDDLEVRPLE